MSVDYKGLLKGNHSAFDIAKVLIKNYGGSNYQVRFGSEMLGEYGIDGGHFVMIFNQEYSDEVKALRPWERSKHAIHRQMHIFTDGACKSDYKHLTDENMTYVSLGHWGECKEIINTLVSHFGGYIRDEAGNDEWTPFEEVENTEV